MLKYLLNTWVYLQNEKHTEAYNFEEQGEYPLKGLKRGVYMELILSIGLIVLMLLLIFLPIFLYFAGKLLIPVFIGVLIGVISSFKK